MKIRGKEVNIPSSDNYTVKLGTVNNKDPKCVYLEIKGWVSPIMQEELNYTKVVRLLQKRTTTTLHNYLGNEDQYNKNVYIMDLDLRESGIQHNKRSYYNCEVTLYQGEDIKPLTELTESIEQISNTIIKEVFEPFEYFDFCKKKK